MCVCVCVCVFWVVVVVVSKATTKKSRGEVVGQTTGEVIKVTECHQSTGAKQWPVLKTMHSATGSQWSFFR